MSFFHSNTSTAAAATAAAAASGAGEAAAGGAAAADAGGEADGDSEPPSVLHLLLKLPQALTTAILKHLDVSSVGKLACVSREFCEATSDPEVRMRRPAAQNVCM